MVSRRQFLALGGGATAAAAAAVGGTALWRTQMHERVNDSFGTDPTGASTAMGPRARSGRVLVVVQLGGGNDGLNTLVPLGDGRYHDNRPSLGVAEADALTLTGLTTHGLHPALAPLAGWWDRGRLAALEGIGLPGQSRSHFQALDTWWRAAPGEAQRTGWLGRWLDAVGDPSDPLRAIAIGSGSPALLGVEATSTVIQDPTDFTLRAPRGVTADELTAAFLATATPMSGDSLLAAAQQSFPATLAAVAALQPALSPVPGAGGGADSRAPADAGAVPPDGPAPVLAPLLDAAARIIDLQLGTEVIVVSISGFDTHANQAATHPVLLADVARGIDGFLASIEAQGRADDVVLMTTSEFGRRVGENGSGTDHGQASVQFVAGAPVATAQVVGTSDLGHLDQGDLPIAVDTRSLYAAALDWLGGPTDDVLGGTYDRLGLLRA